VLGVLMGAYIVLFNSLWGLEGVRSFEKTTKIQTQGTS